MARKSSRKDFNSVPKIPQKKFYYCIESCEDDLNGGFDILFVTTNKPVYGYGDCGIPGPDFLEKTFRKFYGPDVSKFSFDCGGEISSHSITAKSKKEAGRLMAEIAYILEAAGGKRMTDKENPGIKIKPAKPAPL